ncbi:hypothetical protein U1Q18_009419 [Sarracenia purpurea var. burkii]
MLLLVCYGFELLPICFALKVIWVSFAVVVSRREECVFCCLVAGLLSLDFGAGPDVVWSISGADVAAFIAGEYVVFESTLLFFLKLAA